MANLEQLKRDICEIGRRLYQKGFAAANEGNLSCRLDDDRVLCTPTMHSKGFLTPESLAVVDFQGKQLEGEQKRTSEVLMHLAIYRQRPDVKAVVHCHPPHATAFAIAREPVPPCLVPEAEIFLGEVPLAPYVTPNTQAFADTIVPLVERTNVILLANHGTVSFGETVERAYWWTEILDAYCRMLILARSLGRVVYFNDAEMRELLELKKQWGVADPRYEMPQENFAASPVFRDTWPQIGAQRRAFPPPDERGGMNLPE